MWTVRILVLDMEGYTGRRPIMYEVAAMLLSLTLQASGEVQRCAILETLHMHIYSKEGARRFNASGKTANMMERERIAMLHLRELMGMADFTVANGVSLEKSVLRMWGLDTDGLVDVHDILMQQKKSVRQWVNRPQLQASHAELYRCKLHNTDYINGHCALADVAECAAWIPMCGINMDRLRCCTAGSGRGD